MSPLLRCFPRVINPPTMKPQWYMQAAFIPPSFSLDIEAIMTDPVLESPSYPVNELGEVLTKRGSGSKNKTGYLSRSYVPTDPTGSAMLVVHELDGLQGGWRFLQDGRYTLASPLVINNGVKTKINFDLTQLAYVAGVGLTLNYDDAADRFRPSVLNECFTVSFRLKVKPTSQAGTVDVTLESPGTTFNPIVSSTITFNKAAGREHFVSLTQPIFISQDVVTNGLEIYVNPTGTNISIYDYSVFIQKTYIPLPTV